MPEARAGIEPANACFADRCLTTWLPRRVVFRDPHTTRPVEVVVLRARVPTVFQRRLHRRGLGDVRACAARQQES
jgi:hypothetical protein